MLTAVYECILCLGAIYLFPTGLKALVDLSQLHKYSLSVLVTAIPLTLMTILAFRLVFKRGLTQIEADWDQV